MVTEDILKNTEAVQSSFWGLKKKDGGRNVSTIFSQLVLELRSSGLR
jgi:hypothetical protein